MLVVQSDKLFWVLDIYIPGFNMFFPHPLGKARNLLEFEATEHCKVIFT